MPNLILARASGASPDLRPTDEPEWYERLDSARDEIKDASTALLGEPRAYVDGRLVSQSPYREMALELLRSAAESIRIVMEEV